LHDAFACYRLKSILSIKPCIASDRSHPLAKRDVAEQFIGSGFSKAIRKNMLERANRLSLDGTQDLESETAVSLTQVALRRLRDDIICGKLKPGARLRVGKLRDRYGIGASPLREALSRLVPLGFVVSLERRGFSVANISLREFRELTDVRKLLELEAARLSLADGDDIWESRVVAALHRVTKLRVNSAGKLTPAMKEWEDINEAFQETLVSGCASVWLLNFRRAAYFYAKRYLRVCLSAAAIRDLQKDQRAMAEAAIARDTAKLRNLIENQLERTYRKIEANGKLK
jgi:GntR family carbon starvation induced transcriptional regulator